MRPLLPHYDIDPVLMDIIPGGEAQALWDMLGHAGLLKLPYDQMTFSIDAWEMYKRSDWSAAATFDIDSACIVTATLLGFRDEGHGTEIAVGHIIQTQHEGRTTLLDMDARVTNRGYPIGDDEMRTVQRILRNGTKLLIAALNTRNVVHQTAQNPRATNKPHKSSGQFRAGNMVHLSCTRLSLPNLGPQGTGRTVRPHWRQGHVHWWPKADGTRTVKHLPARIVALRNGPAPASQPDYKVTA